MERLVDALGITRLSKSQVSVMAAELDATVAEFRGRPLDAGPYTFVAADALVLKVREGGRVVNVHALVATGVNADGHREILGLQVSTAEDGAGWLRFFRDLTARVACSSAPPRQIPVMLCCSRPEKAGPWMMLSPNTSATAPSPTWSAPMTNASVRPLA